MEAKIPAWRAATWYAAVVIIFTGVMTASLWSEVPFDIFILLMSIFYGWPILRSKGKDSGYNFWHALALGIFAALYFYHISTLFT